MKPRFFSRSVSSLKALIFWTTAVVTVSEPGAVQGQESSPPRTEMVWVQMLSGRDPSGESPEDLQTKLNAHLENFQTLLAQQKLVTAGPISDPERRVRGMALLSGSAGTDIAQTFFAADPFVTEGFLRLESLPVTRLLGELQPAVTPEDLVEYRVAYFYSLTPPPDERSPAARASDADLQTQTLEYFRRQPGNLAYFAVTAPEQNCRAILLFPAGEEQKDRELLSSQPFVQAQLWRFEILPIFVSREFLAEKKGPQAAPDKDR